MREFPQQDEKEQKGKKKKVKRVRKKIVEKEYLPDQVFNADDFFPILGENATKDI